MADKVQQAPTILRRRQVEARVGLSRSTIYEKMNRGEFPPSVSLGLRAVGWVESEVQNWIDRRIQMRSAVKL
jgi:prophage regulatory protein